MAKRKLITPPPGLDQQAQHLAKLEHDLHVKREELISDVVGGPSRVAGWATGAASAIASLFDAGITSGSLAVTSSAFAAAEMLFLKDASARLDAAKKKPDWLGAGLGLAQECAKDGSRAGALMREQWIRLLMACLDSSSGHVVRHADLELLRSLNPPDALLMLAIGRYHERILEDWHGSKTWSWASRNNHVRQLPTRFPLGAVLAYARTIFNQETRLNIDELEWSYRHRHQQLPNKEAEPLFSGEDMTSWRQYFEGAPEPVVSDPHYAWVDRMIDVKLTKRAQRLLTLLVDPREGM